MSVIGGKVRGGGRDTHRASGGAAEGTWSLNVRERDDMSRERDDMSRERDDMSGDISGG